MREDLKNRLFLVAIPRGKLSKIAGQLQDKLNSRFDLYRSKLPPLHVTVESLNIVNEKDFEKAVKTIKTICENTSPFEVHVDGFSFFGLPYKSINLNVVPTSSLTNLSRELNKELKKEGLSDREFDENWKFHISLINMVFADREWDESEFQKAREIVEKWEIDLTCQVEWLELWRPQYNPRLVIEDFFPLKGQI